MSVSVETPTVQESSDKIYKSKVDECSSIRLKIDQKWDKLKAIGEYFCDLYGVDMPTFMMIHRANYYGPYNGEEGQTPAQLKQLVQRFSDTVKYLRALGIDENLKHWLGENYLRVEATPVQVNLNLAKLEANKQGMLELLGVNALPADSKELCRLMLSKTYGLQGFICSNADHIKKDTATEVQKKCEVEKPHFVKAVRIDADRKIQKAIEKKIEKMNKLSRSAARSVSIF